MTKKDDGGAAYPVAYNPHDGEFFNSGMSLRDAFAMAAVQGLAAEKGWFPADAAQRAYQIADAMLAECKKPSMEAVKSFGEALREAQDRDAKGE